MERFEFQLKPKKHKKGQILQVKNFRIEIGQDEYQILDTVHNVKLYSGSGSYKHKPRTFVCFYKQYFCYFENYVESFAKELGLELYLYDDPQKQQYSCFDRYIFMQYAPHPEPNFLFINTEQTSRQEYLDQAQKVIQSGVPLIDYSQENLYYMKSIPGKKFLLRYQYLETEIEKLKSYRRSDVDQPLVDVAFVGTMSPKRQKILEELHKTGVKIQMVSGWKDVRDKQLMRGKILLNIHYSDSYSVYESIRCDRCVFAGMMVVTEKSIHQEQNDINELLFVEEYSNLVPRVLEILNNYDSVREEFEKKLDRVLPGIIEDRNRDLNALRSILE